MIIYYFICVCTGECPTYKIKLWMTTLRPCHMSQVVKCPKEKLKRISLVTNNNSLSVYLYYSVLLCTVYNVQLFWLYLHWTFKDLDNEFHSSAEVYNKCVGPVNERKDEETDRENFFLSDLQTSHNLLSFPHLNKTFLRPTLSDVSGNNFVIYKVGWRQKPEGQLGPYHWRNSHWFIINKGFYSSNFSQPHKAVVINGRGSFSLQFEDGE